MKRIAIAAGFAICLAALCSGCANCHIETTAEQYDESGKVVKKALQKEDYFSQGWSNGSGKTVDVHPQFDLLNM